MLWEVLRKLGISQRACPFQPELERIFPLYCYIHHFYELHCQEQQQTESRKPFYVGISAPQGCGKTTLTNFLSKLFSEVNLNCAVISLDDFYLTFEAQQQLAKKHSDNPLLKFRGNAGTHDLSLAYHTLDILATIQDSSQEIALPRYDKSLQNGRGDRAPVDVWPIIKGPIDIVLLEGWMLGFTSSNQPTTTDNPNLEDVNQYLAAYHELHLYPSIWIVFETDDLRTNVYQWREQAEKERRDRGDPAMTEEQIRDFVDRFMPAYERYLPDLLSRGPDRREVNGTREEEQGSPKLYHKAPVLKLKVNLNRDIVDASMILE